MPSPFPGMDPWLEQHWGDVHTRVVTYASDRLQAALPRDLRARVEERVYLEDDDLGKGRSFIPDVQVVEYPNLGPRRTDDGGVATLAPAEPIVVVFEREQITERFVEIRDFGSGGRLVTVIEVLSLTNKDSTRGRKLYLQKREELHGAEVHLVEIDLLREGDPLEIVSRESLKETRGTPTSSRSIVRRRTRGCAVRCIRSRCAPDCRSSGFLFVRPIRMSCSIFSWS